MSTMDATLQKWCQEFILDSNWPEDLSPEEKLDQHIFPQLQELLTELEKDREYYQYRFYMMQWAFRKIFKAYGDIAGKLEEANIHFLPDGLIKELQRQDD